MLLDFHRKVADDISRVMDYYEDVSGRQLADDFYTELRSAFQKAAKSPEAYGVREGGSATSEPREISISFSVSNRR